jgi:flagellar basal-body rod modification protein FlgD
MVASVSNSSSATQPSSSGLLSASQQSLGKQDFLTLLIAQLKNQDPLKPQDDSAFVAQLAQFSGLEQQMQTNTSLSQIMTQLQGQSNAQLASLVGTTATVNGSTVSLSSSGSTATLTFQQAAASAKTTITIQDSSGNTIRTIDAGAKAAGISQVTWDGRNSQGTLAPAGSYSVIVSAKSPAGGAVSVTQDITDVVKSVSFANGSTVINLNNGISSPASNLLSIATTATKAAQ